jgi:phage terminase large subunit-like protein
MSVELAFVRAEIVLPDGRRFGDAVGPDVWLERDLLAPVFARDASGLPRFRLVYLELPRGHWKSGGAAAIALTEATLVDAPTDVVIAAADRDQAAIVLENLDGYVARNSHLAGLVHVRGDERIVGDNGSRIRVIASDAPSAWGLGGTHQRFRLIADELTVWKSGAMWEPLISATGKVADAQTVVLSNAGFDPGERSWQWGVRETAGREAWGYLFSAPGVIASWITRGWIEQMRALLPPAAFERVIENRWTSGVGDFVTEAQWRRCVDVLLERAAVAPIFVSAGGFVPGFVAGLDLGLTKDRTALAIAHRDGDDVVLDDLQVWSGSRKAPVSITAVERALVDASRRFRPLRVLADPWQFQGSIERLRRSGVSIEEFTFGTGSVQRLSQTLYHAITSAALRVFPDVELEREVLGLVVRETGGGWRIDHRAGGYSDRAIALAMAVHGALGMPAYRSEPIDWDKVFPETAGLLERQW